MNNCRKNHSSSVPFFCILFASNLESNSHMEIFIQTFLFFLFFSFFFSFFKFFYFFYLKPFLLSMNVQPVVFFGHLLSLIHQYSPSNKPVQHYQFSRHLFWKSKGNGNQRQWNSCSPSYNLTILTKLSPYHEKRNTQTMFMALMPFCFHSALYFFR